MKKNFFGLVAFILAGGLALAIFFGYLDGKKVTINNLLPNGEFYNFKCHKEGLANQYYDNIVVKFYNDLNPPFTFYSSENYKVEYDGDMFVGLGKLLEGKRTSIMIYFSVKSRDSFALYSANQYTAPTIYIHIGDACVPLNWQINNVHDGKGYFQGYGVLSNDISDFINKASIEVYIQQDLPKILKMFNYK